MNKFIKKSKLLIFFMLTINVLSSTSETSNFNCLVTDEDWKSYKIKFNKTYKSTDTEVSARKQYTINLKTIHLHNKNYMNKKTTYKLTANQFTDMNIEDLQRKFPKVNDAKFELINIVFNSVKNSIDLNKVLYSNKIHNQGIKCNSGWAYAAATLFEYCIHEFEEILNKTSISAQQLIDCAGNTNVCTNQNLHSALNFYNQKNNKFYFEDEYPNKPLESNGECRNLSTGYQSEYCKSSFSLKSNDTAHIEGFISNYYAPVGLHFNEISFEFLHYDGGIFTSKSSNKIGSHFMVIVGYDKTSEGVEYWKVQNSFGLEWGEGGYIRLPKNLTNVGKYVSGVW